MPQVDLPTHPLRCARNACHTLLLSTWVLAPATTHSFQQGLDSLQRRKAELEVKKLELEVQRLDAELPAWFIGVLGVVAGIVATGGSVWVAYRGRLGALDQSVHDKRLESYPQLVRSTAPLAVYFPQPQVSQGTSGPRDCGRMGEAMSRWYFEGGGLLLSEASRDAYFKLARTLTLASLAPSLRMPRFPADAKDISIELLKEYRKRVLTTSALDRADSWIFGGPAAETDPPQQRFRDYIFLQYLSSDLRTALAEDLRSRRRPAG